MEAGKDRVWHSRYDPIQLAWMVKLTGSQTGLARLRDPIHLVWMVKEFRGAMSVTAQVSFTILASRMGSF